MIKIISKSSGSQTTMNDVVEQINKDHGKICHAFASSSYYIFVYEIPDYKDGVI